MSSPGGIVVLSCGLGQLPPGGEQLLANVSHIFGSARLLALVPAPCAAVRRTVAAQARDDARDMIRLAQAGQPVAALASGDALFHGLGGTLVRELDALQNQHERPALTFVPGITAFQGLFHRLGLPWDNARVFSAHRETAMALRQMLTTPLAVIYTGSQLTAPRLAEHLLRVQPNADQRRVVLAQDLNAPTEAITHSTLGHIATIDPQAVSPTAMLLLLPDPTAPLLPLGLPIDHYEREAGLITPPDVRAVLLSRLRLPVWGELWDIGAGSGSIGLEAAALCPDLTVLAVECTPLRADMIQRNAASLGLANHRTLCGDFPEVMQQHTDMSDRHPDRIVLGGGGRRLIPMLDTALEHLAPNGILAVPVVTLESFHSLYTWHPELRTGLLSMQFAEESPLAISFHHMEPRRPVNIFLFTKPKG